MILMIGIAAIILRQRTPDFMGEDVFFADAARNLLHGFYGVNGNPETTQPPGLPAILALLIGLFGYSYAVCVGAMAIFETLGFLASFELLRRRIGITAAGGICVVLMTSPATFGWATRFVYASFPYFFTTMVALLSAEELEKSQSRRSRIFWGITMALAVVASLLIASGTIALLGAMLLVVLATAHKDRQLARARLLGFLPALVLGLFVQVAWSHRQPAPLQWSLPGYPASYFQQLRVKEGNHPEDGLATWKDVPTRVSRNVLAASDILTELILRHGVNEHRVAIAIIPVLLMAGGWSYALWTSAGVDIAAWYFAGYSLIYLLWPWTMELRFILPVAPLACLYTWQGLTGFVAIAKQRPRLVGILWAIFALFLSVSVLHSPHEQWRIRQSDFPDEMILQVCLISAGLALWMAYSGQSIFSINGSAARREFSLDFCSPTRLRWIRCLGVAITGGLVFVGLAADIRIARENLHTANPQAIETTGPSELLLSDVQAGVWLRSHTSDQAVVMARSWPTVAHYAQRKVIWFPPISDPNKLLDGILRHRVDYVVVSTHENPYYLPDDDYCFGRLLLNHSREFHLVLQRPNLRIFRFDANESARRGELSPPGRIP
jgi:4-amino-4-deoxy-L-arabinose transferase-like glycosyltransferase